MSNVEDLVRLGKYKDHPNFGRILIVERNGANYLTVDGDVCFEVVLAKYHDGFLELVGYIPKEGNVISENGTYLGPESVTLRIAKVQSILTVMGIKHLVRIG